MRLATILLALAPLVVIALPLIPQKVSLEAQALNSRYIVVGTIRQASEAGERGPDGGCCSEGRAV
jgi:hypothetical protein